MERVSFKEKSRSEIWRGDMLPEDNGGKVEYIHGGNESASLGQSLLCWEYKKRSLVLSKIFSMSLLNI